MRGFLAFVQCVMAMGHSGPNGHAEVVVDSSGEVQHVRSNEQGDMVVQDTDHSSRASLMTEEVAVDSSGEVEHVRRKEQGDMEVNDTGHTLMASSVASSGEVAHVRHTDQADTEVQDTSHSSRASLMTEEVAVGSSGEDEHALHIEQVQDTGHTSMASLKTEEEWGNGGQNSNNNNQYGIGNNQPGNGQNVYGQYPPQNVGNNHFSQNPGQVYGGGYTGGTPQDHIQDYNPQNPGMTCASQQCGYGNCVSAVYDGKWEPRQTIAQRMSGTRLINIQWKGHPKSGNTDVPENMVRLDFNNNCFPVSR